MKFRPSAFSVTAISLALLAMAGCDRGVSAGGDGSDPAQRVAKEAGKKIADNAVREARIDALEARVGALENQSDASEDSKQDARLDMVEQELAALTKTRALAPSQPKPDDNAVATPDKGKP